VMADNVRTPLSPTPSRLAMACDTYLRLESVPCNKHAHFRYRIDRRDDYGKSRMASVLSDAGQSGKRGCVVVKERISRDDGFPPHALLLKKG
jgi:hypothetical protein